MWYNINIKIVKKEMNMLVEKNKEYKVKIIDNGYEGEGIAKTDDFTIFIKGAIKGETCKIVITKVNKSFAFGKLLEVIQASESRTEPDCATYKRCGGCSLRHIKYDETLKIKKDMVQNLINKGLENKITVNDVIGMETPYNYRNKLQYPVGVNKDGEPIMGVFANRTHEIIPIQECLIQNKEAEKVAKEIFNFIKENHITIYNETTRKGAIRHIIVKIGVRTNEIMCIIVTNEEEIKRETELVKHITQKYPNVKFVGWKKQCEVSEYMKFAKALVFPSIWYETAGLTILEAQNLGTPCIINKNTAASEFLTYGNLYETYEELKRSLINKNYIIKEYKYEDYITNIIKVYKKI